MKLEHVSSKLKHVLFALLLVSAPAQAHVGSPDVFYEGQAGPYRLFVTIRPPEVIPGVAEVQIRALDDDLHRVEIVPLPVLGEAAHRPPAPDVAQRSHEDARLFTGSLWLMHAGSWQVRVKADGARGAGMLAVPVAALPQRTAGMKHALAVALLALLLLLCAAAVSIAAAAARESTLPSGQLPGSADQRRARWTAAVSLLVVAGAVAFGRAWWNSEADNYARYTYKPLEMKATVDGGRLALELSDPGWLRRRLDDWVPDHDHLMHLFIVRLPDLDRVWHLHPSADGPGRFLQPLPAMPAGRYRLFADLVHRSGLPETVVTDLQTDGISGAPLEGDDSTGSAPAAADFDRREAPLADGARLVLVTQPPTDGFHFRVVDGAGQPTGDLEPYMGMLGHAAFVARDLSVFAHVHPTGSVPMASVAVVDPEAHHHAEVGPSEVAFPYRLPKDGAYRLFVQIKRRGQIETAAFDVFQRSSTR
jgi:hypothetical protein